MLRGLITPLIYRFNYYVRFRGNNIAYLRYLGVKIGDQCRILTTSGSFGKGISINYKGP
jgi:hypothetical protein